MVKAQKSDAQLLHGTDGLVYAFPVSLHQVGPSHHGAYGLGEALPYRIQDVKDARMAASHDNHQLTSLLQHKADLILK